ncbi:MAG: pyrroline-5-carboxylate reductase [Rhodoferax sp.]|nr:pyrroline-5-carboxylate reductase [Rhodoferax sp.]
MNEHIAFIGGGNMATAIISGLLRQGVAATRIDVVEPVPEVQHKLSAQFGIRAHAKAGAALDQATLVVWAVKPQHFKDAAHQVRFHARGALHLSVAAGIPSDSIAQWLGNERIIRAMPNTPALIGKGIAGLYARPAVTAADRQVAQQVIQTTGDFIWLSAEEQLDAVTAISGSGPAYVFYFMEAMTAAGSLMGLPRDQAYELAVATFIGAGELARASDEPPEILRQRVTSKGGTTHAAISSMDDSGVKELFTKALLAAQTRAHELGREFGAS